MVSHWNPPTTPIEAILALIILFLALAIPFTIAVFWLRALPAVASALVETTIAAHGGPVVVRETPAIVRTRADMIAAQNEARRAARY